jgi:hypothetical protein
VYWRRQCHPYAIANGRTAIVVELHHEPNVGQLDVRSIGPQHNNGINAFIDARSRATFAVPHAGPAPTRTSPGVLLAPGCRTRSEPEAPSRLLVADLRSRQHPSKPAFRGRDVHERRCLGELAVVRRKRLVDRAMFANRLL